MIRKISHSALAVLLPAIATVILALSSSVAQAAYTEFNCTKTIRGVTHSFELNESRGLWLIWTGPSGAKAYHLVSGPLTGFLAHQFVNVEKGVEVYLDEQDIVRGRFYITVRDLSSRTIRIDTKNCEYLN